MPPNVRGVCATEGIALLEEFIERGTRVFYFSDSRRRFALNRLAGLKQRTLVSQFLLGDAFRYRFSALEPRAGGRPR